MTNCPVNSSSDSNERQFFYDSPLNGNMKDWSNNERWKNQNEVKDPYNSTSRQLSGIIKNSADICEFCIPRFLILYSDGIRE